MSDKKYRLFLVLWAMTLGLAAPGRGQAPAAPTPSGPPDVLVIVYQRPGIGDEVGITYPHTVPRAQAQQDLAALAQAGGWTPAQTRITDASAPIAGKMGAMTSVSFVAPGVIQDASHAFPLDAFVRAFRGYKRLNLVFFVSSEFQFQGQRQFADNDVQVVLDQHGSAYTYQIRILNPQIQSLTPPPVKRRSPWFLLLGIVGAACVIGLLVYFVTARLTGTPGQTTASGEADAKTKDETEIGTRG